jgi:hypothetical protein
MSRSAYDSQTDVWDDGDNPGAGSKTVDSHGLNGNFIRHSVAIKAEHTEGTGVHKDSIIGKNNLKSNCVDGVTLELDPTNGLQVKASGISKLKLNDDVADGVTLERDSVSHQLQIKAVTAGKIKGSGTGKAVDGTTITLNGSNELQVADDAATAPKISHDNTARKNVFVFTIATGQTYGYINNVLCTASWGMPMPRSGYITKISSKQEDGTLSAKSQNYSSGGTASTGRFNAGDSLSCRTYAAAAVQALIAGTVVASPMQPDYTSGQAFVTVEVEFDD